MAETRTFKGHTYTNGELPKSLMKKIDGKHGTLRNSDAYLRSDAADALNGAIKEIKDKYGYDLTIRGWNRTKAEQAKFFYQRWTTRPYAGRPTKRWNGKTWYLKPGYAAASAPGYSNHGWGTTIDVNDFGSVGNFNHPNRKKFYPILRKWGFDDSEGRGHIREPWHLEYKDSMNKMKGKAQHKRDKKKHWRTTTEPTHIYGKLGKGGGTKRGRLLPKGYDFTVKNGSGRKRDKEWWVQTTAGNWIRSAKTKEI